MIPAFWQDKRVFLTGHTGFKRFLAGALAGTAGRQGQRLCAGAAHLSPTLFALSKVETILAQHSVADIRDLEAVKRAMASAKPDIVIHMAAQAAGARGL